MGVERWETYSLSVTSAALQSLLADSCGCVMSAFGFTLIEVSYLGRDCGPQFPLRCSSCDGINSRAFISLLVGINDYLVVHHPLVHFTVPCQWCSSLLQVFVSPLTWYLVLHVKLAAPHQEDGLSCCYTTIQSHSGQTDL